MGCPSSGAYHCPVHIPPNPDPLTRERQRRQDAFFQKLKNLDRFEVRLGRLRLAGKGEDGKQIFVQKRVDILLGIDFVQTVERRSGTHVVLVGGDSDFVPLIQVAKNAGLITRLFHSSRRDQYAQDLWTECDERSPIDAAFLGGCRRR